MPLEVLLITLAVKASAHGQQSSHEVLVLGRDLLLPSALCLYTALGNGRLLLRIDQLRYVGGLARDVAECRHELLVRYSLTPGDLVGGEGPRALPRAMPGHV